MPLCENCTTDCRRTFNISNVDMCENCAAEYFKESKLRKPGRTPQNEGFEKTTQLSTLLSEGKKRVTSDMIESLRKLPITELQKEILNSVATLTAATAIYGDKWIAESLKQQKQLAEQQAQIMHDWRVKQQIQEREKRAKSEKGNAKKFYQQTGKFIDEFANEMAVAFEKRLKEKFNQ